MTTMERRTGQRRKPKATEKREKDINRKLIEHNFKDKENMMLYSKAL